MLPPNTVPPDVALLGAARSGKSTAAALLTRKWGHVALGFADALRDIARDVDPVVAVNGLGAPVRYTEAVAAVGYDEAKARFPLVREFLQRHGVATRDHLGEDVWVEALERKVEALDPAQPVVLTDVRFRNEVRYAQESGMVLVRLTREGSGLTGAGGDHISEALARDASVDVDFTFSNDGPLDDLEAFLDGVVLSRARSL